MPLIATIKPEDASGDVAEIYAGVKAAFGSVPSGFQIWSSSPVLLRQFRDSINFYMSHPHLSFPLLAAMRLLISVDQHCTYCVDMNASMLMQMAGWTQEQVAATRADVNAAPLSAKDKALLALVLKAVRDAANVTAADLDAVRAQGWGDADILDAVNHGARQVTGDIVFNTFKVERDF